MKADPFIPDWTARADTWLAGHNLKRDDVVVGADAWYVAHKTGFWREANDAGMNDGVVRTALEKIFPNAVFKDKKTY